MNGTIMSLTSIAALLAPGIGSEPAHADMVDNSAPQFVSLSGPDAGTGWDALPGEKKLDGVRLTQYQETFAPLDFDPANPEKSQNEAPARTPIWPSPLIKNPAPKAPRPAAPAVAAPAPAAPNYYPAAAQPQPRPQPQPQPAYAPPAAAYAPLPGRSANAGKTYQPRSYNNLWGMPPPPPPPPPPVTDWGNNPFGPQVAPPNSTGNVWNFGSRAAGASAGNTRRAPAYGYGRPPGWEYRFAPADPIGRDAKNKKAKPAYPHPGARPPAYGWPGYAPYPGF